MIGGGTRRSARAILQEFNPKRMGTHTSSRRIRFMAQFQGRAKFCQATLPQPPPSQAVRAERHGARIEDAVVRLGFARAAIEVRERMSALAAAT